MGNGTTASAESRRLYDQTTLSSSRPTTRTSKNLCLQPIELVHHLDAVDFGQPQQILRVVMKREGKLSRHVGAQSSVIALLEPEKDSVIDKERERLVGVDDVNVRRSVKPAQRPINDLLPNKVRPASPTAPNPGAAGSKSSRSKHRGWR